MKTILNSNNEYDYNTEFNNKQIALMYQKTLEFFLRFGTDINNTIIDISRNKNDKTAKKDISAALRKKYKEKAFLFDDVKTLITEDKNGTKYNDIITYLQFDNTYAKITQKLNMESRIQEVIRCEILDKKDMEKNEGKKSKITTLTEQTLKKRALFEKFGIIDNITFFEMIQDSEKNLSVLIKDLTGNELTYSIFRDLDAAGNIFIKDVEKVGALFEEQIDEKVTLYINNDGQGLSKQKVIDSIVKRNGKNYLECFDIFYNFLTDIEFNLEDIIEMETISENIKKLSDKAYEQFQKQGFLFDEMVEMEEYLENIEGEDANVKDLKFKMDYTDKCAQITMKIEEMNCDEEADEVEYIIKSITCNIIDKDNIEIEASNELDRKIEKKKEDTVYKYFGLGKGLNSWELTLNDDYTIGVVLGKDGTEMERYNMYSIYDETESLTHTLCNANGKTYDANGICIEYFTKDIEKERNDSNPEL